MYLLLQNNIIYMYNIYVRMKRDISLMIYILYYDAMGIVMMHFLICCADAVFN